MYGLKKEPEAPFAFDLEEDLKGDAHKIKKLQAEIQTRASQLKSMLREGTSSDAEFNALGTLLQGYDAMLNVLDRIKNKKETK